MIQKTRLSDDGVQLYVGVTVGKNGVKTYSSEGKLSEMSFTPSDRRNKRHLLDKPHPNNRKNNYARIVQHTDSGVVNHMTENRINNQKLMVQKMYKIK